MRLCSCQQPSNTIKAWLIHLVCYFPLQSRSIHESNPHVHTGRDFNISKLLCCLLHWTGSLIKMHSRCQTTLWMRLSYDCLWLNPSVEKRQSNSFLIALSFHIKPRSKNSLTVVYFLQTLYWSNLLIKTDHHHSYASHKLQVSSFDHTTNKSSQRLAYIRANWHGLAKLTHICEFYIQYSAHMW